MSKLKPLIPAVILINLVMSACIYVVLPQGIETKKSTNSKGWTAVATNVSQTSAGDLHVDLTIRNETGDWSTMKAVEGQPALLTTSDSKKHNCDTIFVGTGGHRLAPGLQIRGYTSGTQTEPKIQQLYVECKGITASPGAKITIDYIAYSGELDYYHQEEGMSTGKLDVELDKVETDLTYPVFETVDGLVEKQDTTINALSDNVISLLNVKRTDQGFEFTWQNYNPTEFALKIHIGNPPVIGSDGIIYNRYEIMDLATTPLTPAKGKVEWVTKAVVPSNVTGCYILLSVESKNMRLYVNHLIDITDK